MDIDTAVEEANRCLQCNQLCDICTTVCPNMANQHYQVEPHIFNPQKIHIHNGQIKEITEDTPIIINQQYQTLNIADWCNECGNCTTFCPTAGRPYADKPRLHLSWQSFIHSPYGFHVQPAPKTTVFYKDATQEYKLTIDKDSYILESGKNKILLDKSLRIKGILNIDTQQDQVIYTSIAVQMTIILQAYQQIISNTSPS